MKLHRMASYLMVSSLTTSLALARREMPAIGLSEPLALDAYSITSCVEVVLAVFEGARP